MPQIGDQELPARFKGALPALEAIRLAPSAHNTQPWRLRLLASGAIGIEVDPARTLPGADPAGDVIAHSLGCAIEAAATVCEAELEPGPDAPPGSPASGAGRLIVRSGRRDADAGLRLLRERGTQRAAYRRVPLAPDALGDLVRAAQPDVDVHVIDDATRMARIATATAAGASACLREPAYVDELMAWMRVWPAELSRAVDGFTPANLCLDPGSRWAVAWLQRSARARRWLPALGMAAFQGWLAARTIHRSGALLLLTGRSGTWLDRVRSGRALLRLWRRATEAGLALQPVYFPLTRPELRRETYACFAASDAPPVTMLRVGRCARRASPSPRRPLADLCVLDEGADA